MGSSKMMARAISDCQKADSPVMLICYEHW
jgi:hypothetical protein